MVLAAKKESVQAGVPIRCFVLVPIQDTALLMGAAYPFWTCVRGPVEPDDRPRTLCTNCTQGIQYPHAGICLLGIELPRGFHTFPRGCRFPGRQERRTPPLGTSSERKSHREAIYPSTNWNLAFTHILFYFIRRQFSYFCVWIFFILSSTKHRHHLPAFLVFILFQK